MRAWQLGRAAGPPAPADQPAPPTGDTGPGDLDSPDPGPRVRAVLADRIRQAGPAAREVAELAAVIGRDFTLELLTEASDLDSDAVVGAVDELWRRRIIREHPPASYDFFHDLLRDTAYGEISPPRRGPAAPPRGPGAGADPRRRSRRCRRGHRLPVRAGGPRRPARCRITCGPRRSRPACSPTRRPSATTGGPPSCCGRPRRAASRDAQRAGHPLTRWPRRSTRSTATPRPSCKHVLERARDLAEQLGDTRLQLLSLVGLFGVRLRAGAHRRVLRDRQAQPGAERPASRRHRAGALRGGRVGDQPGAARSSRCRTSHWPTSCATTTPPGLVGTRVEVHARAWSAHALLAARPRTRRRCTGATGPSPQAEEIEHPYSLAVALSYAAITHQLRGDVAQTMEFARRVTGDLRPLRLRLLRQLGPDPGRLVHGRQDGAGQIRQGLARLRDQGAMARQPYYLSLLAETLHLGRAEPTRRARCWNRPAPPRPCTTTAGGCRSCTGWTPSATAGPAGTDLLRRAVSLAEEQGSAALLRRATADLAQRRHAAGTDGERSPNAPPHTVPADAEPDQAAGRVSGGDS